MDNYSVSLFFSVVLLLGYTVLVGRAMFVTIKKFVAEHRAAVAGVYAEDAVSEDTAEAVDNE